MKKNTVRTEEELIEELTALRRREAKLQSILDCISDLIFILDAEGRFVDYRQASKERKLYVPPEVFLERHYREVLPPQIASLLDQSIARLQAGEAAVHFDYELEVDGERKCSNATIVKCQSQEDGADQIIVVSRDMTERRNAENSLAEANARLEQVLMASPAIIYRCDLQGETFVPTFVSSNIKAQLGYGVEDCLEAPRWWSDHIHPEDAGAVLGAFGRALSTKNQGNLTHEYRFMKESGKYIWVRDELNIFRNIDGKAESFVGSWLDISAKREAEEAKLKLEKLEAVGVLAGGIAHDFNNILTSIYANVSRITCKGGVDSEGVELLEGSLAYAKGLAQQLLTFAKGGLPVKRLVSIPSLLEMTAAFALSGSSVKAAFNLPEDLLTAEVDEGQLCQVINNLVINAMQAMPDGGTVTVSAENFISKEQDGVKLPAGNYICIAIADEGMGIETGLLPRIFEPYFTTKTGGSGLGLATAYAVVAKHGGLIDVESKEGTGTTFRIYLPASEEKLPEAEEKAGSLTLGRKRILLMDDEELLRNSVGFLLTDLGYDLVFAADGREALELFKADRAEGGSFDAVILDLTVPGGMGGEETMKRLLKIDPTVKAVVTSGYSNSDIMANYEDYGFAAVLPKPYDIEELNETLITVINTKR